MRRDEINQNVDGGNVLKTDNVFFPYLKEHMTLTKWDSL